LAGLFGGSADCASDHASGAQHLEFPALRFIQQRQISNRRRLQLRHLLLLLLRMLAICLLAFALARPSIKLSALLDWRQSSWETRKLRGRGRSSSTPRPAWDYRLDNKTRLEIASENALWLLGELPVNSEVAGAGGKYEEARFQVDIGAARQRIERWRPVPSISRWRRPSARPANC